MSIMFPKLHIEYVSEQLGMHGERGVISQGFYCSYVYFTVKPTELDKY